MENNSKQNNTIKNLLEKIESKEITSHSKTYFRVKFILFIFSIIAIFIVSIFFCSFIIFNARVSGQFSLIGFGGHGISLFLKLFPWKLFILDITLMIFAGWLLRSFRFGYKTPTGYLFLGIILIITLMGIVVDKGTSLHYILLQSADNHKLPVIGKMYKHVRTPPPKKEGVFRGSIKSIEGNIMTVNVEAEENEITLEYKVILSPIQKIDPIKIGDTIFIAGEIVNGEIHASVIQLAPEIPSIFKID